MSVKVGINGFGRIGRQVLKAIRDFYLDELDVVAFNDIGDMKTMAHLLKYDSNYGRFNGNVEVTEDALIIDGKSIKAFKETDPGKIPWGIWEFLSWSNQPGYSPSRKMVLIKKGKLSRELKTILPKVALKK